MKDDIARLYLSKKGEKGALANIEECVDAWILGLKDYIKKGKERLITAASNSIVNKSTDKKKKKKQESRNGIKKNTCMDISSDKQAIVQLRTHRQGLKTTLNRDKRRFVPSPMKNHQLSLVWKSHKS